VARRAEDAGFDTIFSAKVNNDALATAQLMGVATTWIAAQGWPDLLRLRLVCSNALLPVLYG